MTDETPFRRSNAWIWTVVLEEFDQPHYQFTRGDSILVVVKTMIEWCHICWLDGEIILRYNYCKTVVSIRKTAEYADRWSRCRHRFYTHNIHLHVRAHAHVDRQTDRQTDTHTHTQPNDCCGAFILDELAEIEDCVKSTLVTLWVDYRLTYIIYTSLLVYVIYMDKLSMLGRH